MTNKKPMENKKAPKRKTENKGITNAKKEYW
jgi:hypothetical protein